MQSTILFLALLVLAANAAGTMTLADMKASQSDATEKVVEVLNSLKQSAIDERASLDVNHQSKMDYFAEQKRNQLQLIAANKDQVESAQDNVDFIEDEQQDTADYLAWIEQRFVSIATLVQELRDERCEASLIFVTRLREHFEAIDAIALLRGDLQAWRNAGHPTFAQIKELPSFNKLSAFTQMYKQQNLDEYLQLTDINDGYMDESRRDLGDDFVDNEQGEQVLQEYNDPTPNVELNIVDRILQKLDDFEFHLGESLKDLTNNEIRAGRDTVRYIQEAEQEVYFLENEKAAREVYQAKLVNDLVVACNYLDAAQKALDLSKQSYQNTLDAEEAEKVFYMNEVMRLRGDVAVVDQVIEIFHQELAGIDDIIRGMKDTISADDFIGDRFSQGAFSANDDNEVGSYTGEHGYNAATQK